MRIYNRNAAHPDRPANWWLDYHITQELRARYELSQLRIRESGCGTNKRASERLLAKRKREIDNGTWSPPAARRRAAMTFADVAERWVARREADGVRTSTDEAGRLRHHALGPLGARPVASITREDIRLLINGLVAGGELAPRTVHHVYDAIRGVMGHAVEPLQILERNPCDLSVKRGELPRKRDKNPGWRRQALYRHGELFGLLTDERIPVDRRTFYGLLGLGGLRFGEAAGRKVEDYDTTARPLGRLLVATQYDGQPLKGDGPPREVPVHPMLQWLLEQWLQEGFELVMGRAPRPDDWLVPSRRWAHRSLKHMEHKLDQDAERIGQRRVTPHDLRRTFITLVQSDGGARDVLERVTHKGPGDVWSGYTQYPWEVLCAHVAALRIAQPTAGGVDVLAHGLAHPIPPMQKGPAFAEPSWRDGRDLNPRPPA